MKFKVLVFLTVLLGPLFFASSVSFSQSNLNEQLRQAICAQNWSRAVQILQEMKRLAPSRAAQLTAYQSRLQNLAQRGTFLTEWQCATATPSPVATPIANNPESGVYRIPIKRRSASIPVVDVTFNGQETAEMMFDTGASSTLILHSLARKLNLQTIGKAKVTIANGSTVEMDVARVASLKVGDLTINDTPVTFGHSVDEGGMDGLGLLGQSVYGHYDVTIKENEIELRERK